MTRFACLYPEKDASSKIELKSATNFIEDFGLPILIISDRGSYFTSYDFQRLCDENRILHSLNSTSHLQGNEMVQRSHKIILCTIIMSIDNTDQKDCNSKNMEVEKKFK
ncbi:hypothetical protein AVEN_62200-1 [Araneus ventricosus]|uniref:Integrase catalytic domain-containing protein n=1 Tax=Araneus ventricosus TaxID=182803 RepID=A0A4Y2M6B7_ARAVE|nr:hypothetical protein AVEN_62200-1 [Araneus ventricosus]